MVGLELERLVSDTAYSWTNRKQTDENAKYIASSLLKLEPNPEVLESKLENLILKNGLIATGLSLGALCMTGYSAAVWSGALEPSDATFFIMSSIFGGSAASYSLPFYKVYKIGKEVKNYVKQNVKQIEGKVQNLIGLWWRRIGHVLYTAQHIMKIEPDSEKLINELDTARKKSRRGAYFYGTLALGAHVMSTIILFNMPSNSDEILIPLYAGMLFTLGAAIGECGKKARLGVIYEGVSSCIKMQSETTNKK